MIIGGFQKTSLIDYPSKIASVVFTQGCNFRCGYCHNPELIELKSNLQIDESFIFDYLKKRKGLLDAVVISGGEPCIQGDLAEFIRQVKNLDYLVKLDTNGSFPFVLERLFSDNLIDYIAMDIKAPLYKYREIANAGINLEYINKSIDLIKKYAPDYEFRTTVVKSQLSFEDINEIAKLLKGAKKYYLQSFVSSKILDNSLKNEISYTQEEFLEIKKNIEQNIQSVFIR